MPKTISIANQTVGKNHPLLIISGPCVIESQDQCLLIAEKLKSICDRLGFIYVFKASFDKANRSSIKSPRGPGIDEGLKILEHIATQLNLPVTTDIHESPQADPVGRVCDIIQIPAFLCRQTDLLVAAAKTQKIVNVKKGQFLSPPEMQNVTSKLEEAGAAGIILTERGTFFGYNRLVNDFVGLADMIDLSYPVCFDVTHSTQQPGGHGTSTAGRPDRAPLLANLAVTAGVHALFIETHPSPQEAFSDSSVVLDFPTTEALLTSVHKIHANA